MPTVLPFRGLRYDPKHVGSLAAVMAPPFDAIDRGLEDTLDERHPANAVRLECHRDEPGDDDRRHRGTRSAKLLHVWLEEGVLMREPAAAVYVVHQECEVDGRRLLRRGVIARLRLERFGTGNVRACEETPPGLKADRLRLLHACRIQAAPVLGIYPDDAGELQEMLDAAVAGQPPVEAADSFGITTRLWPVIDEAVAAKVAGLLGPQPLIVADGHHRYEAACELRDELAAAWAAARPGAPFPADHPAGFVAALLVGAGDPGLVTRPAHRLLLAPTVATAAELCGRLGACFTTRTSWRGPAAAEAVWSNLELEDDQAAFALYTAGDQAWTLARITPAGRARMDAISGDHGAAWRGVGTAILHRLVFADLLGLGGHPPLRLAATASGVADAIAAGEVSLAAMLVPPGVEAICGVTETGDRLPAGSVALTPWVPAGLVFYDVG